MYKYVSNQLTLLSPGVLYRVEVGTMQHAYKSQMADETYYYHTDTATHRRCVDGDDSVTIVFYEGGE